MKSIERGLLFLVAVVLALDHVRAARAGGDPRSYAANEFTLLSDQGKTVGTFRISVDGLPELVLGDSKGHGRIVLAVKANDDAIVGITDASGKVRAGLVGEAGGQHSLALSDDSMLPRLSLSVGNKGLPRISIVSAKKKELVSLQADENGVPRISVTTEAGDNRLEYGPSGAGGVSGLYLFGKGPTARAGLEIDEANAAHAFAQDASAKARAECEAAADSVPWVIVKDKSGKRLPIK